MDTPADKAATDAADLATEVSKPVEPVEASQAAAAPEPPAVKAEAAPTPASAPAAGATPAEPKSALIPFVEPPVGAEARTAPAGDARAARFDRLLAYGAHAALIVALVGFAWAVSGHFFHAAAPPIQHAAKLPDKETVTLAKDRAERAEIHRTTVAMAVELRALKSSLDAMRTSAAHNPTVDEVRFLSKSIDGLKSKLEATKTETAASLAQLSGKIEHAQQEPAARWREVAERLTRIERQTAAPTITGSLPAPKVAVATVNPKPLALPPAKRLLAPQIDAAVEAIKKPQLISGWVVRDVYQGIALVEGPRGAIEVVPGETIPGAGTVKSIERRGAGWIVVTSKGLVDFARN